MIRNLFGGSKCRTIDVCDIFGDGSGKALYRLDGNANDESGNYHGTETAITYGGGVYERGAVFNGSSSKIQQTPLMDMSGSYSVSFWFKTNSLTADQRIEYNSDIYLTNWLARITTSGQFSVGISFTTTGATVTSGTLIANAWYHTTLTFNISTSTLEVFINGTTIGTSVGIGTRTYVATQYFFYIGANRAGTGNFWNGSIDQVRIFNRAITATEVATLYAECAPTSTVDNINPFEDGSLKALYQFNGDATDKTGVYNGTATNVTYGTGKFGQCAVFNGSSSKVDTGIPSSSFLTFSLTGWAKAGADTTGMIVNKGYTGLTYKYNNVSTQIALEYYTTAWQASVLGTVPVGTWFHYSIVYTAGILKAYIDGNLKASISATITDFSANIFYGMYRSGASYFNGSIDQARFFNKALTPMEVASLYNETTPLEEPMHSLVDPFKDGSGKALYRLEGNRNDESGNYNTLFTGTTTYVNGVFGRAGVIAGVASGSAGIPFPASAGSCTMTWWGNNTGTRGAAFGFCQDASHYVGVYAGTANTILAGGTTPKSAGTITYNATTRFYAIVFTGGTAKVYVNGTWTGTTVTMDAGFTTINSFTDGGSTTTMYADQVCIFNRALTQAEVTALYQEI